MAAFVVKRFFVGLTLLCGAPFWWRFVVRTWVGLPTIFGVGDNHHGFE